MEDETYFRQAAERLLTLMTQCQKKPVHRNARDLSTGEVGVMRCLYLAHGQMTAGEVSHAMDIGTGGVANLLNSLERKGYIRRVMDQADRRRIMVSLSESGQALADEREREALRLTEGLLTRLGREDTRDLLRIYQRMVEIGEAYVKSHDGTEKETN